MQSQVFIDATGTLDQADHQLFKLMCASPAGGLPLGFMVLSGKDEELIAEGLEELKKLLPKKAFFKRGEKGPTLVMTDDDDATINAIQKVWPDAQCLLCTWHNVQAVFRWLHDGKHSVRYPCSPTTSSTYHLLHPSPLPPISSSTHHLLHLSHLLYPSPHVTSSFPCLLHTSKPK